MDLPDEIKSFFKGDIETNEETLEKFSHDASIFDIKPEIVVFPKDSEDIEKLVEFTEKKSLEGEKISLSARSAGTDMTGGPLTTSIVVEFTRYMNKIEEVGEDYAITQPGVFYRDFEKETLKHDLLLPSYPASRDLCAMGGIVANNSGGEKSLTYGKTEDYLEEVWMVLRDGKEYSFKPVTMKELDQKIHQDDLEGEIYQKMYNLVSKNYEALQKAKPDVSKNSAGYFLWNVWDKEKGTFNLNKMIVGSQGTLGIITKAKLRLIKPKKNSRLLVIFLKDMKPLAQVTNHVLQFKPESFESYDDHTFRVALQVLPQFAKRLGGNLITLAFSFLPEFWMVVSGGVPKLVLMAEFTSDSPEGALQKAQEAQKSLESLHLASKITKSEKDAAKYWTIRRESFNMLRHKVGKLHTAPFIDDLVVKPEKLPQFLPELYEIMDKYKLLYTIAGHVGDGNFHIIPLMNFADPKTKQIIMELSKKVYELVIKYKGTITGEHNDGLIRGPFLKEFYGEEVYKLFEETKKIFDPDNIFNPGKKVDTNLEYAMNHVTKE